MREEPARKLAVLLHADVAGSTALVRLDETIAHQRIQDAFGRFSQIIIEQGGTAHEIRGDALVAEFSKASDALSAAVAFQDANSTYNENLSDDIRPVIRVGIAMGEVVVADNTVTGEGIVLAQRLEQLAVPGGVCIQDAAYQTVPKRLPFVYEFLGEQSLKGFADPVRAYAVCLGGENTSRLPTAEAGQQPVLGFPDKPSIAVLPFTNMSGDPEQQYFSDGMTEDIITELSRFRELFVIARNSSFVYKDKASCVQEIGAALGVRYVVEGSVRKAGDRIRVTAQLVESRTGHHVWADRYDRSLEDIFAVQDEITEIIVATIAGRLEEAQKAITRRKPPQSLAAYDLLLRGKELLTRAFYDVHTYADSGIEDARQLFNRALALDPEYGLALACLAETYLVESFYGSEVDLTIAAGHAEKAVVFAPDDSRTHCTLSWIDLFEHHYEQAKGHIDKAVSLNRNDPESVHTMGCILCFIGQHEEAITWFNKAAQLDPFYPPRHDEERANALYLLGRYDEAAKVFEEAVRQAHWVHAYLGACYAQLGRMDDARAQIQAFLGSRPGGAAYGMKGSVPMGLFLCVETFKNPTDREHWYHGLRQAGLDV